MILHTYSDIISHWIAFKERIVHIPFPSDLTQTQDFSLNRMLPQWASDWLFVPWCEVETMLDYRFWRDILIPKKYTAYIICV